MKLKIGSIVTPRFFIPGYPTGVGYETRLRVVQRQKVGRGYPDRVLCVRDDGREGQWWIDIENLLAWGDEDLPLTGLGANPNHPYIPYSRANYERTPRKPREPRRPYTTTAVLPAFLASALIGGDTSGLEESDMQWYEAALKYAGDGQYVDVGEPYFAWRNELPGFNLGADVAEYTILYAR